MVSHVLQMMMKYAIIHESEESISLWNIQFQSWIISNDDLKKKKKNCEKQKATRMAQISFPTLNAHKNRTNCATVHQRNAKKAS